RRSRQALRELRRIVPAEEHLPAEHVSRLVQHLDVLLGKRGVRSGWEVRSARAEAPATIMHRRAQLIIDAADERRAQQAVGRAVGNEQTDDDQDAGPEEQPATK